MVGLEALAAGCLLVARRSAGYACIVDESRDEGLLFDGTDAPALVAARIVEALGERERFAVNGRRKVESTFDARDDGAASRRVVARPGGRVRSGPTVEVASDA